MIAVDRLSVPSDDARSAVTASSSAGASPHEGEWRSFKTGPHHLQRQAVVYVRQSSPHQMTEHRESLSRQYALRDRAAVLGWAASTVVVIDEDLGLSGRGSADRRGFQRLLADVAQDRVGLVLAIEMSRLAQQPRLA